MKEITLYRCEFCNTQFANKSNAEKCEAKHLKVKKVKEQKYKQTAREPHTIVVEMENGEKYVYESRGKHNE